MTLQDDMKQWLEALERAQEAMEHAMAYIGDDATSPPAAFTDCKNATDEVIASITSLRARIAAVDGDVSPAEAARRAYFGAGRHGHPEWATLDKQSRATWGRVADAVLTASAPKEKDHE